MTALKLDLLRSLRRYQAGFAALAGTHLLALLAGAQATAPMLKLALGLQLAAALLFFSMIIDDLRANASPETVALVPNWRARQRRALAVWLVLGLLLPPALAAGLAGPAAALVLGAVIWPASALIAWFHWMPQRLGVWTLCTALTAAAVGGLFAIGELERPFTDPRSASLLIASGLLAWIALLRRLPPEPGSRHCTHWRETRAIERQGEAILHGGFDAGQLRSWHARLDLAWARRHRPAPGPARTRAATLAQLRWLLGPALRPKSPLGHAINIGAIALVLLGLFVADPQRGVDTLVRDGGFVALLVMLAMLSYTVYAALRQSRAEQVLLYLLPGMPAGEHAQPLLRASMLRVILGQLGPVLLSWLLAALWVGVDIDRLLAALLFIAALLALDLALVERLLAARQRPVLWPSFALAALNLAIGLALLRMPHTGLALGLGLAVLGLALLELVQRPRAKPLRLPLDRG